MRHGEKNRPLMKVHKYKDITFSENIPEKLKKSILSIDSESVLMEISSVHKLNENEENIYFELCRDRLFAFGLHTFRFTLLWITSQK